MVKQVEQMLVAAGRKAQLEVTYTPQDTDNTGPNIITENDDAKAGITQALDFTNTTAYRNG